jgi:hypothetical protein
MSGDIEYLDAGFIASAEPREDTRQAGTRPTAGGVPTVIRTEFKIGRENEPKESK